ncbi:MAG: aminoacyl-tRNA hydrolase [Bacteroidota bacterium]|nr:aminoacyl-tRNA hydrolase [Bacteroidota bacterium]
MKYLIVGLGNIGPEYHNTRHNIGFTILDALAGASNISFSSKRYGWHSVLKFKGRQLILIKPSTYVNLSGKAVNYWLQKENIPVDKLLVVLDDLALPFGTLRLKSKGSDGGHNGLKSINQLIGTQNYPRLRFGIGGEFGLGQQVDYVLGNWSIDEKKNLSERIEKAGDIIKAFTSVGINRAMNQYNNS